MTPSTVKRTRVGDPLSALPWANVVSEMVLAYLWVADWRSAERVCRALARQVKQYARRFHPWHAVRCLLPPKTLATRSSVWMHARYTGQEVVERVYACTKHELDRHQQRLWKLLHAFELSVSWWAGEKDSRDIPVNCFTTIRVVIDMVRDSATDVCTRIVHQVDWPIAPNGSAIGKQWPWHHVNFSNAAPLWQCHPSVRYFDSLRVALQSQYVPDAIVNAKLHGVVHPVQVSLNDTFATFERYLAAILGQPNHVKLRVAHRTMRRGNVLRLYVQSGSTIRVRDP